MNGANLPNEDPANTGTAFNYNLRFPGQYFDQETGTHQNGFREYDPQLGRYGQSDPIGLRAGLSTYGYVGGSPLLYTDPRGESVASGVILGIGVVGVAAIIINNAKPKPKGDDGFPGAANDSDYEKKQCPPDDFCVVMRKALLLTYYKIQQFLSIPGATPQQIAMLVSVYELQKRLYEARCGPFDPPPLGDIYLK